MSNEPSKRSKTLLGKEGEEIASAYLLEKEYLLICNNYRHKKAEIDLIAQKKDVLVFVEVKYRTSLLFGYPESFVTKSKQDRIRSAADNYIFEKNWKSNIRFDIISIVHTKGSIQIEHFEDCF